MARSTIKIFFPSHPLGQPIPLQYFIGLPICPSLSSFPTFSLFFVPHPPSSSSHISPLIPLPPYFCFPLYLNWYSYWAFHKRWAQSKLSELIVCLLLQPVSLCAHLRRVVRLKISAWFFLYHTPWHSLDNVHILKVTTQRDLVEFHKCKTKRFRIK